MSRAAYAERTAATADPNATTTPSTAPAHHRIGADTTPTGHRSATAPAPRRAGIGAGQRSGRRPGDVADAPAQAPEQTPQERARAVIDRAMAMSVSSSDSDDFVRNNVTAEVLQHATPAEKAHMLKALMDGPTGGDDEAAMARILESVSTPAEMRQVLDAAGGAHAVWDELEGQRGAVGQHFAATANGRQVLLAISDALPTGSSLSDDFVRNHVDAQVLAQATNQQKSRMLRHLMEGPTGGDDEAAMARVLGSISDPDDMMAVMDGAGGAEAVFDELEGSRGTFMRHLDSLGADGDRIIARMATSFAVSSSSSDDFVRDHVDADVLRQATPQQKGRMLRNLMDGPTGADDEAAMARVLGSTQSRAELEAVLTAAGGADGVWDELEDQQGAFIRDLKSRGATGQQMVLGFATSMSVTGSDSDDFIRNHVDNNVLSQASVADKSALITRLRDGNYSSDDQAAARRILRTAANPVELMNIADGAGGLANVLGMNAAQRQLVTDAYNANSGNAAFVSRLNELITDPAFIGLNANQKTAVLSQARNYPNERSVHNMRRLIQKSWFNGMNLADQQRSLKMVAYASQHPGHRVTIDNTLDRFLSPDAEYEFDWSQTGTAYGSAGSNEFHFNRAYLPAGNGAVNTANGQTLHMVSHTIAHEVNHLVNGDEVAQSFDYFMEEYRAFYVGFRARHNRNPTRAEVRNRVRGLLTANSGAYNSIRLGLADATEGPKFLPFLRQVMGRNDVTQANAGTIPFMNANQPAPAPTDGGDMDN